MPANPALGRPHVHLRTTGSTNAHARELAARGAPHGTLVTADEQTAAHGRQGRVWHAPAGQALACSWVIRDPPPLLSLAAGVAVAQASGPRARIKWPNDVLIDGRKVAGILVEARPHERWAVLGVGVNAAVDLARLPREVAARAGTLGLSPGMLEGLREELCQRLERWLPAPGVAVLAAVRERDALFGRRVSWESGAGMFSGSACGVDDAGRLRVRLDGSRSMTLDAGEVHLLDTG